MTRSHPSTRVGLIGFGAIGRSVVDAWSATPVRGHTLAALLVREHQQGEALRVAPPGVAVCTDIASFLAADLQLAVEVAGHGAVISHGERILEAGVDLAMISVGSLADDGFRERLERAAAQGASRLLLPIGAIAGLDGLLALRRAGLSSVKYTSTKPPASWKDTPADGPFDLDALTERTVIFSGTAADAARLYPKNANLAAVVALAGLGLQATKVELVADPSAAGNSGLIEAVGPSSTLTVKVAGASAASNPKTSQITGMSVLAALDNRGSSIAFI
ncbi:aspartate dehydrogenase [Variovorax sp. ZT4R33]|uniref:aspartate dehydrogenase n=1 Tax=Variovorax sp. ZT4R33 TaxID=3443743 RepID=UPI003F4604A0